MNAGNIFKKRWYLALASVVCLSPGLAGVAVAEQLKLANEYYQISCDTSTGQLLCMRAGGGSVFANGSLGNRRILSTKTTTNTLQGIGTGQSIEISYEKERLQISIVPAVPFVFFRPYVINASQQEQRIDRLEALELTVLPDAPMKELRALGSGGLRPVEFKALTRRQNRNPPPEPATAADPSGSYMFLAVAEPATRNGVVSGWISSDRGSGIVFNYAEGGKTHIRARIDYGRLIVPAKSEAASEIFAVGAFDDARLGLEAYADAIAKYYSIRLPRQMNGYCTWYSRPNGGACDEENILKLAEAAKEKLVPFGFDFIQIDDKWQDGVYKDGPRMVFNKVRDPGPYAHGMKPVADQLKASGLTPGLWWIPFGGKDFDPFFADKQGLFVKNEDGTPRTVKWGGAVLDLTRPATLDYVAANARLLAHDWGFDYFKLDGLWVGTGTENQYGNNEYEGNDKLGYGIVGNPNVTPIEAYRNGLKTVRKAAGKEMFLLGCNVSQNMRSFGASFGLLDAMRIGPDNKPDWKSLLAGPWHGANRYFLNGRVWYNDPDPLYVRNDMPIEHARLICSWVSISGSFSVFSEWLPGLEPERVHLLQRTLPSHGLSARPVDLFDNSSPNAWVLRDPRSNRSIVALFNWDEDKPATIQYAVDRLGLPPGQQYETFEFWTDRPGEFSGALSAEIPAASCRVFAVRPAESHPQVISTSRHITQGLIDIVTESWDASARKLAGASKVVAGDRYELRVVVPAGFAAIQALCDGAPMELKQDGSLLRVGCTPVKTGTAEWNVSFQGS